MVRLVDAHRMSQQSVCLARKGPRRSHAMSPADQRAIALCFLMLAIIAVAGGIVMGLLAKQSDAKAIVSVGLGISGTLFAVMLLVSIGYWLGSRILGP